MPDKMTTLEKIELIAKFLDNLADAQGRAKCGYIYIIDDVLNKIKNDVLVMEEQINDLSTQKAQNEEAPVVELVETETESE